MELITQINALRQAQQRLASASAETKNQALKQVMLSLSEHREAILAANSRDVQSAREKGMSESLVDRLQLTPGRLGAMNEAIQQVIDHPDPVGRILDGWTTPEGLKIRKVTVPFGLIAIIYESRPNVTVEAFSLALKSGNSILLRGSGNALSSNIAIVEAIRAGLAKSGVMPDVVDLVRDPAHEVVDRLITMRDQIDLIIPRGGAGLIRSVVEHATVPVIETGVGNNHIFVERSADWNQALDLIENAKTQRPGTCNAVETVLVDAPIAKDFLPLLKKRLEGRVQLLGCPKTQSIIDVAPATNEDFSTEFLDLILAIRVVDGMEEAVAHIAQFGTHHSEAICTENLKAAEDFLNQVDAAAVYVNASTRFTDGGVFGFGGEMGISTQKLHARGPMGMDAMLSYKYLITGDGQIRS